MEQDDQELTRALGQAVGRMDLGDLEESDAPGGKRGGRGGRGGSRSRGAAVVVLFSYERGTRGVTQLWPSRHTSQALLCCSVTLFFPFPSFSFASSRSRIQFT